MRLTVRTASLELRTPLRISRSVMARRDAVWLTVEDGQGAAGHGEVVSSAYLGLSAERAKHALLGHAAPALARQPHPEAALSALLDGTLLPRGFPPGVTAAVDSALLDLVGKRAGLPVHRLLTGGGGSGDPGEAGASDTSDVSDAADAAGKEADDAAPVAAATARTIGITDAADAASQAGELAARGFRVLKIKAGSADPAEDLDRVAAVRDAAPGVRVLLDPNGAWTPTAAEELLPRFAALGVEAVEQPTAAGDPESLARLAERSPVPLIADEDAAGYDEALRLAGRVHGVNIKLAKCGGVHQALRIAGALDGSGTDVMLGCLAASSLGIAPAVHLVARARWVDLDGHLLLAHDPWQGIGGADGTVRAADRPGLGVHPAARPEEDPA
ncbi:mandelate racemase/muconate lactonizing enzyme family protein [Streptomyces sp. URMC 129]|uniref:mandelate racemase/muconate lactonizing enzyme family protein n=1 Tax=Streptomyces sp. URMC 129 TaxID=3423407 RepID=UPI003F19D3FE